MTFFQWLNSLIHSLQGQQILVFWITGFVGMYFHYLVKALNKEIRWGFIKYLFGNYGGRTLTSLVTFMGSGVTYVFSGSVESLAWPTLLSLALTTGYAIDSAINKGDKPDFHNELP